MQSSQADYDRKVYKSHALAHDDWIDNQVQIDEFDD